MRRSPFPLAAYCVLLFVLLFGVALLAAHDDAQGTLSLVWLRPPVDVVLSAGRQLVANALNDVVAGAVALAAMLFSFAIASRREPGRGVRVATLLAFALAVGGQAAFVAGLVSEGLILYVTSALVLLVEQVLSPAIPSRSSAENVPCERFDALDLCSLTLLTGLAIFFRVYALNQVVDYFEGELSPYSAGATDLRGMLFANVGDRGPWAPLGYFYYLPIFVTTKLFGTTVLAIRLASAMVSTLTVPLLYGLLRRLAGRETAIIGAFLVALDPLQIGWGRSDIHPHGATVWTAILLCWATINALDTGQWSYALAMSLFMGLSCHHYPSGQAAVLIPVVFFGWICLFERTARPRLRHFVAIFLGLVLWLVGLALPHLLVYGRWQVPNLFTIFGARTSWSNASSTGLGLATEVGDKALANLQDLIAGVFVKVPYLFHQCFIPEYPYVAVRTVVWIVAPFATVVTLRMLLRRGPKEHALLVAWAVTGLLPAVFSAVAYPKRASIAYPALIGLGAVGLAAAWGRISATRKIWAKAPLLAAATLAAMAYVLASTDQWFSGNRYPYGVPKEVSVERAVAERLRAGTIVIGDFWNLNEQGKFAYLLIDALRSDGNRPSAWFVFNTGRIPFEQLVNDFPRLIPSLQQTIWYEWTPLWSELPAIHEWKDWTSLIWIAQIDSSGKEDSPIRERLERLKQLCPDGESTRFEDQRAERRFEIFRCSLPLPGVVPGRGAD